MITRNPQGKMVGFTLAEVSVVGGVISVVGLVLMQIFWSGSILFMKNSAINVAHQEARSAVMRIESDLHSCVSVPQLVDNTRTPVSGFGPASGIAFHAYAGGPYKVVSGTYGANQNKISVSGGTAAPAVNQRFNLPTHYIESYITAVSKSGSVYQLTLETNLANQVTTLISGQDVNISAFTTEQVAYLVQSGELRQYPKRGSTSYKVMSTDVVSTAPFSIPQTAAGAAYNRFVAAINLSCADHSASKRNFRAANMYLNAMVPYRARLTETQ
jgi:hypothetical protein